MKQKFSLKHAMGRVTEHAAQALTFQELADAYCAVHYNGDDMRLRKWVACFGERSAWELTTRDFSLAAEAMMQSGQYEASTVNRDLSAVGTAYKWAVRRHLAPVGFVSPTTGIPRYEEAIRRVQISAHEIRALLAGAKAYKDRRFAVLVHLAYETGGRRGELRNARWKDIDLDAGTLTALQTKTGKPRVLFFSPDTAALMRRVWPMRAPEALLFESRRTPGKPVDYKKSWEQLTSAIGRPDLHLHDLRHHRAAELLKSGTSVAVAAQVLGHSSLILQRRYGHLENAALQAAAQASW